MARPQVEPCTPCQARARARAAAQEAAAAAQQAAAAPEAVNDEPLKPPWTRRDLK